MVGHIVKFKTAVADLLQQEKDLEKWYGKRSEALLEEVAQRLAGELNSLSGTTLSRSFSLSRSLALARCLSLARARARSLSRALSRLYPSSLSISHAHTLSLATLSHT
jgi:hypothetical protein